MRTYNYSSYLWIRRNNLLTYYLRDAGVNAFVLILKTPVIVINQLQYGVFLYMCSLTSGTYGNRERILQMHIHLNDLFLVGKR